MQSEIWGFKNNVQPEQSFYEGDLLLFASGYTGKNIRLPVDQWLLHSITRVATAVITSRLSKPETTPHWPDETAANRVLYPQRFRFEKLRQKDGQFALGDINLFPRELSLALRKAAIGGKAQVIEVPTIPEWLIDGVAPPPSPATTQTRTTKTASSTVNRRHAAGNRKLYRVSRIRIPEPRPACLLCLLTFQAVRDSCRQFRHRKVATHPAIR